VADYTARAAFSTIGSDDIVRAARCLEDAVDRRGTIFVCGNDGSAAIANHVVCDHVKGASTGTNIQSRVHSLSTKIEIITAIAHDVAYENIFELQLARVAEPGDVLVSSSGRSPHVITAIKCAKKHGFTTIAMTSFEGGPARLPDIALHVNARNYGIVEDVHQSPMHILVQYLRQKRLIAPNTFIQLKF